MLFSLKNGQAAVQRVMEVMLSLRNCPSALVHCDDIMVYPMNVNSCMTQFWHVLSLLKDARVTFKLKKCSFSMRKINYMGHVIRLRRMELCEVKIAVVREFKDPTTQTEMTSFMVLGNDYHSFV